MNILLTTSAAPNSSPFSTSEKRMPLGIGFLISTLKKHGHNVFFIDNYLKPSNFLETGYLIENHIDYIGIYTNTICYTKTLEMLFKIQKLRKCGKWNGKIILGGPHTSVALQSIPEFVDHIIQGEGEQAILDVLKGSNTRVIKANRIIDLDSLPMPAWEYFIPLPYDFSVQWFKDKPVFNMNTSRGCPFRCAFCSVGSIWGSNYTFFSAERILRDIEYLQKIYNIKGIYFREDNFTMKRQRVIDFCEMILKKNIKLKWICESRVNTLDYDLIKLMSRAGCKAIYFGVESGSQRLLDLVKKDITIEQTEKTFEYCKKLGVNTSASFLIGIPTETRKERAQTISFAKRIKPTTTWINIFVGIPRSKLYEYSIMNDLYEYVDDVGLIYLKGHDQIVDEVFGGNPLLKIPRKHIDEKIRPYTLTPELIKKSKPKIQSDFTPQLSEPKERDIGLKEGKISMAEYYLMGGKAFLKQGNSQKARGTLAKSIKMHCPYLLKSGAYYMLALFPDNILRFIISIAKKIKNLKF